MRKLLRKSGAADDPARSRARRRRRARVGIVAGGTMAAAAVLAGGIVVGHSTPDPAEVTRDRAGGTASAATPTRGGTAEAVRVAIHHLGRLNGPAWYDAADRAALLDDIAVPELRDELVVVYDEAARQIDDVTGLVSAADEGDPLISQWSPLGYEVEREAGDYVSVRVWGVTVTGTVGAGAPPQAAWATTTVTEQWTGGAWRLAGIHTVRGPVPVGDDATPTDPADLVPAVLDLEGVTHEPR